MGTCKRHPIGFVCVLISLCANRAVAESIINFEDLSWGKAGYTVMGWRFYANQPLTVTGLGFCDPFSIGLYTPKDVAIWTDDGALLASGTVEAGTSGSWVNRFRYTSVASTQLTSGWYRIAAYGGFNATYPDGSLIPDDYSWYVTGLVTNPAITYDAGYQLDRYYAGSSVIDDSLAFPTVRISASGDGGYFGPSFMALEVEESTRPPLANNGQHNTPEPGSLALLGCGLAFAALRRRRGNR